MKKMNSCYIFKSSVLWSLSGPHDRDEIDTPFRRKRDGCRKETPLRNPSKAGLWSKNWNFVTEMYFSGLQMTFA